MVANTRLKKKDCIWSERISTYKKIDTENKLKIESSNSFYKTITGEEKERKQNNLI